MDKVYGFHNRTSSDVLNLEKYFKEYNELTNLKALVDSKAQKNSNEKDGILEIMEMDIGDEDFAALSEYCRYLFEPNLKSNLTSNKSDCFFSSFIHLCFSFQ